MADCLFCKIIKGEIPSYTIWEDDKVIAFLDIFPASLGHTLIIPKEHSQDYLSLSSDLWFYMGVVAQKIARAHMALGAEGTNLLVTQGESAGQTVFHTHWHVIPRKKGDKVHLGKSGEPLSSEVLKDYQSKMLFLLSKHSI